MRGVAWIQHRPMFQDHAILRRQVALGQATFARHASKHVSGRYLELLPDEPFRLVSRR